MLVILCQTRKLFVISRLASPLFGLNLAKRKPKERCLLHVTYSWWYNKVLLQVTKRKKLMLRIKRLKRKYRMLRKTKIKIILWNNPTHQIAKHRLNKPKSNQLKLKVRRLWLLPCKSKLKAFRSLTIYSKFFNLIPITCFKLLCSKYHLKDCGR